MIYKLQLLIGESKLIGSVIMHKYQKEYYGCMLSKENTYNKALCQYRNSTDILFTDKLTNCIDEFNCKLSLTSKKYVLINNYYYTLAII